MILVFKVLFGSVAVATLAGSLAIPDAVEAARSVAASMPWTGPAEVQDSQVQQAGPQLAESSAQGGLQLPPMQQYCSTGCEGWALLSKVR